MTRTDDPRFAVRECGEVDSAKERGAATDVSAYEQRPENLPDKERRSLE